MQTPLRAGLALAGWLALCFSAAAVGSLFSPDAWYAAVRKPAWQPPDAVFGPVWTTLYVLMAVAAWLVARTGWRASRTALILFVAQLVVNAAWSWLFFGCHAPFLALLDLSLLLVVLAATMVAFARRRLVAAWMLAPYAAWCAYAWTLNAGIWWLNR